MSVSSIASASDMQMDYMKLLVTQLQHQNPLEPLSNNEMASQLAQFSQLQQLESMNSSFAEVHEGVIGQEMTGRGGPFGIGTEVTFRIEDSPAQRQR